MNLSPRAPSRREHKAATRGASSPPLARRPEPPRDAAKSPNAPSPIARLLASTPVLLDGAFGTALQARGLAPGDCADRWNLVRPECVEAVARSHVDAGSRVILTNTFRANRVALRAAGLASHVRAINRAGVELSLRAAGDRALVFGSVGPSGRSCSAGDVDERALRDAFAEQIEALGEAGAQAVVLETMSDPAEAVIAIAASRAAGLPVVACMVFGFGAEGDRTTTGARVESATRVLLDAGADGVGANCGNGIEPFVAICARMRAVTDRPIWIKPNAGIPSREGDRLVYRTTPTEFAASVPALCAAGANFIGGCCGTGPEFVRAIRNVLAPLA